MSKKKKSGILRLLEFDITCTFTILKSGSAANTSLKTIQKHKNGQSISIEIIPDKIQAMTVR